MKKSIFRQIVIFPITLYRACWSAFFPPTCRHIPSCSHYTEEAIHTHGVIKGLYLSIKRICSCHPWGTWGYEPVPPVTKHSVRKRHES